MNNGFRPRPPGSNIGGNSTGNTNSGSTNSRNSNFRSNTTRSGGYVGTGGGGYNRGGPRFRRFEPQDAHRINHRITAREVLVIGAKGEQHGVMSVSQGVSLAQAEDLDLVEVSPNSQPPVCRIMDYGKFKYKEQKKEAEAKKNRSETTLKEIRLRYNTDIGDFNTKIAQAKEFIGEGHKVKFSMRFKGREAAFVSLGVDKFNQVVSELAQVAGVDERSPAFGKQIHIIFSPIKATSSNKATANPGAPSSSTANNNNGVKASR